MADPNKYPRYLSLDTHRCGGAIAKHDKAARFWAKARMPVVKSELVYIAK
jgi:hypothetical protein